MVTEMKECLRSLGLQEVNSGATTGTDWLTTTGELADSYSPVDGKVIGKVKQASREDYEKVIACAENAFKSWRMVPAPKRGEIVRQIGNELRDFKEELGRLVSYE